MIRLLVLSFLLLPLHSYAKKNVVYKYKKYEKFDFETMDIEGNKNSPGDLSISPRFTKKFKNKIPERRDFNREMRKAIDTIR